MVAKHSVIKKTWLLSKYNVVVGLNLPVDISSPSVYIAWYVQPLARSLSLMIPEPLKSIIILSKKTDFHWRRALMWPVYILSYSLAGARLPVNISY